LLGGHSSDVAVQAPDLALKFVNSLTQVLSDPPRDVPRVSLYQVEANVLLMLSRLGDLVPIQGSHNNGGSGEYERSDFRYGHVCPSCGLALRSATLLRCSLTKR